MKVRELAEYLSNFKDQDAEVRVLEHHSGSGWYDQGGNCYEEFFDTEYHVEYTDFRGNPHVGVSAPHYNQRYLLLGSLNN